MFPNGLALYISLISFDAIIQMFNENRHKKTDIVNGITLASIHFKTFNKKSFWWAMFQKLKTKAEHSINKIW